MIATMPDFLLLLGPVFGLASSTEECLGRVLGYYAVDSRSLRHQEVPPLNRRHLGQRIVVEPGGDFLFNRKGSSPLRIHRLQATGYITDQLGVRHALAATE